jgi:hypothetical protein
MALAITVVAYQQRKAPETAQKPKSGEALALIDQEPVLRELYVGTPLPTEFATRSRKRLTDLDKAKRLTCDPDLQELSETALAQVTSVNCVTQAGLRLRGQFRPDGTGEILFTAPSGDIQLLSSG